MRGLQIPPRMLDPHISVADLVSEHSECAALLHRYHLDDPCDDRRTLAQCCAASRVSVEEVGTQLERAIRRRAAEEIDPRPLSTREVIVRVVARHHQYLYRNLPFLRDLAAKVARVHGEREPQLLAIAILVDKLAELLLAHLQDEERNLFPELLAGTRSTRAAIALERMDEDHDEVVMRLEELREVADHYAPPPWACLSYRTLMVELSILDLDTLRHLEIEETVLFPRFAGPT